ncbi:DUF2905 domain-containing protein [Rossellomorea marisflavi]|uniref:DUF2905 domain-containing protein n=1 Tax=Rossellomorea marisflavi TaxID=189381 RepID=A0A0M0GN83_9BACI|nr:DUF2905 domain-containing protein [Rossellomorea marisflavi]KON91238.1 hypothetical protein AF331_01485 [Rossellomorea marisflavi]MCM2589445.1 DUF2905 domain-containing protein [Rossellomorea marisflavi]UTE74239.1 DUF2905 domain-containing protein [Rossellomorea marisflavi]
MSGLPKVLMIAGAVLLVAGLLLQFTKLGKLPGDIVVKKENATFYFPLMTSVLLSVILSLVFYFIGRFK